MARFNQFQLDSLVSNPAEGLNVEIKRWLDPEIPSHQAKIIKATIGLRNRNGGFLIVGIDDRTLEVRLDDAPADPRQMFNVDTTQALISKYVTEPFEIEIGFSKARGILVPVIIVPPGVQVPVAAKRDLNDPDHPTRKLVRENAVYFRTLNASGRPSTSEILAGDWRNLLDICFDNREADIGRFLRRLVGDKASSLLGDLERGTNREPEIKSLKKLAVEVSEDCERRFREAANDRCLTTEQRQLLEYGSWSVTLVALPQRSIEQYDDSFFAKAVGANPQLTGWPIWVDSRPFHDEKDRPYVKDNAREALMVSADRSHYKRIDFLRISPEGRFYLLRNLPDDGTDQVTPKTVIDPTLSILRVAEAIIVALAMTKATGWVDGSEIGLLFKWTGLAGRELQSWAHSLTWSAYSPKAKQDEVESYIRLQTSVAASAIAPLVMQALQPLFVLFDGQPVNAAAVEHWTQRLLERRL